MNIGELIFQLGFKADTMKLKDFAKGISELNMQSIVAASGFGGLYEAAKKAVGMADEMGTSLNKFRRETGQNTDQLQRLSRAAEEVGVSGGVVESTLKNIQDTAFLIQAGKGENSNIWNMLNVDPTQASPVEVLDQMREKFKYLTIEERRFFLQQLNINEEMLNMFAMTDKQWVDIAKQMTISKDQLEKINQYHTASVRLGNALETIWVDVGVALVPAITKLAEGAEWLTHMSRESWAWKGSMDAVAETLTRIVDGWAQIGKFSAMVLNPSKMEDVVNAFLPQTSMFGKQTGGQGNFTNHNIFHIKSTDPAAAGREVEQRFKKSIGESYFSRSNGEH